MPKYFLSVFCEKQTEMCPEGRMRRDVSVTTRDNECVGGPCPRDRMIEKGQEKGGRMQEKTGETLAVSF